jgi:hypothetical protein
MKTRRLEHAIDLTSVDSTHVQACLDLLVEEGGATFARLIALLGERGVPTEGIAILTQEGKPNTLLWEGLSFEAYAVFRRVVESPDVELRWTTASRYWTDGRMLKRLEGARERFYTEKDFGRLTWMPVVLLRQKIPEREVDTPKADGQAVADVPPVSTGGDGTYGQADEEPDVG